LGLEDVGEVVVPDTAFEVLIVEDDAPLRDQIAQLLGMWGYRVRAVADVAGALAALGHRLPDIILTDLVFAEQSGLVLLEHVHARKPELPVLVMTAYASLERAIEALKQGAYDFLLKPVMPPELAAALARAVHAIELHRTREREQYLQHVTEVALTLAHEINNPLAVIMGELQLQLETPDEPIDRRSIEVCLQSARRIADVMRTILTLREVVHQEYGPLRTIDLQNSAGT
jgi:CheY-like chemotaxis protein